MRKEKISKGFIGGVVAIAMVISSVSTALAGNVYGDDGSHVKVMTTAGELDSLPLTNFKGTNVYLMPADSNIWISSAGSTADPSTIYFSFAVCPKETFVDTNNGFLIWDNNDDNGMDFDKQHVALFAPEASTSVHSLYLEDINDGSWLQFWYILDDGSYSATQNNFTSGWKQDSIGWWYQNADGSYPKSAWQLINGKYYYFNGDGYMLSNTTTPDGYKVNSSGAWIQ
ncbi:hypothetical protein [Lacrimispora sp.]|uniref:hypothetical protein n=1 Tax=Lacrimispora sp. TaxID=2719234 RepID=UPI002897FB28|nr:hypothetical protein [Lacrimispora sp.]